MVTEKLISAKRLKLAIRDDLNIGGKQYALIKKYIDEATSVDAVEVVHGRWIMGIDEADYDYGVCSVCGFAEREHFPTLYTPNYCPNCGAKMDGERKDNG